MFSVLNWEQLYIRPLPLLSYIFLRTDEKLFFQNENIHLYNSKCRFSHSGSCTRIPYLHILKNQRKLHQKSATGCECNKQNGKNDNEVIIV